VIGREPRLLAVVVRVDLEDAILIDEPGVPRVGRIDRGAAAIDRAAQGRMAVARGQDRLGHLRVERAVEAVHERVGALREVHDVARLANVAEVGAQPGQRRRISHVRIAGARDRDHVVPARAQRLYERRTERRVRRGDEHVHASLRGSSAASACLISEAASATFTGSSASEARAPSNRGAPYAIDTRSGNGSGTRGTGR